MFLPVEPEFDEMRQAPGFQRLLARVASEGTPRTTSAAPR